MKRASIPNLYVQRGKFYYAKQLAGTRPFVALNTRDEMEAIRRVRELERSPLLRAATSGLAAEAEAFVAYKLGRREYSRDSAATKILILRELAEWLPAGTSLADVHTADCERFYGELRNRVSDSTAESYMVTLRSFCRWGVEVRRVRLDNPIAKVHVVETEHVVRKRFVDKQTKNSLIKNSPHDDLRFIQFCGFDAGLRRGEISEARTDWFELRHGSLHVQRSIGKRLREGEPEWRPKYNKERVVPLTVPFRKFLSHYLRGLDPLDFALQPDVKHGDWRYRYDIRRPFADYMHAQGMDWVTPHVMRHSFASILKTEGESIAKIADWLGDTERVTEKTYAHLKPDDRGIHRLT